MKILVLSDSHSGLSFMRRCVDTVRPDYIIHLGDYMDDGATMAEEYPQYGFEIHKGYGTKAHYAALTEHGACPIHRMTFLKKFYGEK